VLPLGPSSPPFPPSPPPFPALSPSHPAVLPLRGASARFYGPAARSFSLFLPAHLNSRVELQCGNHGILTPGMFAALSMVALVGQANKPACGLGNDPATGTPRVKCSVLFFAVDDLRSAMPPPALVPHQRLVAFGCEFDRLMTKHPAMRPCCVCRPELGAYGSLHVKSPNIDKFASSAMVVSLT